MDWTSACAISAWKIFANDRWDRPNRHFEHSEKSRFSSVYCPCLLCSLRELFLFGLSVYSLLTIHYSLLVMKAMILAAGLGTRLRPLTNDRPKALVEINGKTLLQITIERLAKSGVREIIVNVHHFADMVAAYLKSRNNFGLRIEISREDDLLLDTGGGLKEAAWFLLEDPRQLNEPFLLHNVDVVSNIDFSQMLKAHQEKAALATLAVQSRESSRQLLFNDVLQLVGRRIGDQDTLLPGASPSATRHLPRPLAFSGVHVLSPRLLSLLTESTPVFSIIDSYLRLASEGQRILAFRHDHSYWRDLGRPSDLAQAASDFEQNKLPSGQDLERN
jgi:mannose-1-phosphate guanylyltransferase